VAGSCEHNNEHSGSMKGDKFIEYLSVLSDSEGLLRVVNALTMVVEATL
jgi:hypothetical protein